MRDLSNNMKKKLASHVQAGDSALSANVWVSRPNTQLVDDIFLEKQKIPFGTSVTKASVAVCHPRLMRDATDVYVGYVDGGTAKVAKAVYNHRMANHEWVDTGFAESADDISICFDGTMPKNIKGMVEFKTKEQPWVFWIHETTLYGRQLGADNTVTLAETNCLAVSAVRAMWSQIGMFDFGLIVFFILNGNLFYRQCIGGTWYDGELVNAGPEGVLWSDVSAFRTWDYRIGVQLVAQDGSIYELFTQFMGIGKQNVEHIDVRDFSASYRYSNVRYSSMKHVENIDVGEIDQAAPFGGLYSLNTPKLLWAENMQDENGDWGKLVKVKLDVHVVPDDVANGYASFSFTDTRGVKYSPRSATLQSDGKTIVFEFLNFNNAEGVCQFQYKPGSIMTMAGNAMVETSVAFTPHNLVPNGIPAPVAEEAWNE